MSFDLPDAVELEKITEDKYSEIVYQNLRWLYKWIYICATKVTCYQYYAQITNYQFRIKSQLYLFLFFRNFRKRQVNSKHFKGQHVPIPESAYHLPWQYFQLYEEQEWAPKEMGDWKMWGKLRIWMQNRCLRASLMA